jgi:hypothetical protein
MELNKNPRTTEKGLFFMDDYSRLAGALKREILRFAKKICVGIGKPERKLVSNMLYGIAESGSCELSKIGRALRERITLKKTIERLSRGMKDFSGKEQQKLQDNYNELIRKEVDERTIYVLDESDVTKPHSEKLEGLARVRDGSSGAIEKGYLTLEITALTKMTRSPLPVYDRVYSAAEAGFESQDVEVLKGLKYVTKTFGHEGIRTLDRGYDALVYYEYFMKNHEAFITRCCKDRNVRHQEKTLNIMGVALKYKGKYRIDFEDKAGKRIICKIAVIPVSLPKYPKIPLNLVVVYGFGKEPMLLLTNLKSEDKRLANTITKVYLMRWRIEEYFRFKKQQYNFEGFRVRSLNAIRALHRIVTLLAGLISILSEKRDENVFVMELIAVSKRIMRSPIHKLPRRLFLHYAIADGIFAVLRRCSVGIAHFLCPAPSSSQLSFFSPAFLGRS